MTYGYVNVVYCPSTDMVADVLTKGLSKGRLVERGVRNLDDQIREVC